MLTVSLHGITIHAKRGMYAEEQKIDNHFEVDADIIVPADDTREIPFVDYSIIRATVAEMFEKPYDIIEHYIRDIHAALKSQFPEAEKIKVTIRKLNPPMPGQVAYAQIVFKG